MKIFASGSPFSTLAANAKNALKRAERMAKRYRDALEFRPSRLRVTPLFTAANSIDADVNLFLITSVVNAKRKSIYTPKQRLDQLLSQTVRTIKEKIPSPYIVVIEGSKLSGDQVSSIKDSGVNELYFLDVNGRNKSKGELILISSYFKSLFFKRLTASKRIKTVNKLSGRYYLGEDFNFAALDENLCVIKRTDTGTWSGHGFCSTRYYKFPFSYIEEYMAKIDLLKRSELFIDIEHSFYKHEVIPFDRVQCLDNLNIKGSLAPNGEEVFD